MPLRRFRKHLRLSSRCRFSHQSYLISLERLQNSTQRNGAVPSLTLVDSRWANNECSVQSPEDEGPRELRRTTDLLRHALRSLFPPCILNTFDMTSLGKGPSATTPSTKQKFSLYVSGNWTTEDVNSKRNRRIGRIISSTCGIT